MAGYTRQDISNNIADGNIINAVDLNNEFDAVESAFNGTTGHSHNGTNDEGGAITKVGPAQDITVSSSSVLPKVDNAVDLGSSSFEFKDLYIDGTANIDNLVADAGTINGTTIPASSTLVTTTATQTLTNKTVSGVIINDGYTEEIFAISGTTPALSPTNGSIQTWVLSGNSTPTVGTWAAGQSMTMMVDDGAASTIIWTTVNPTWTTEGGAAPTLNTSGYTVIVLWKVDTTIYGARVGEA